MVIKVENDKYDTEKFVFKDTDEQAVIMDREVFSLDVQLMKDIEDFIHREKLKGRREFDVKTQKPKKINKSLWARKVLKEALEKEKYYETLKEEEANKKMLQELQQQQGKKEQPQQEQTSILGKNMKTATQK